MECRFQAGWSWSVMIANGVVVYSFSDHFSLYMFPVSGFIFIVYCIAFCGYAEDLLFALLSY